MDYRKLAATIRAKIEAVPWDIGAYTDLFSLCRNWEDEDHAAAHGENKRILQECREKIKTCPQAADKFYEQWRKCLLFEAPYDFDSYLTYVELNREAKKRFYPPRKKMLGQVVKDLQALADDQLDLLAISLPPGVGKTTLAIFYLTWLGGKYPNDPMLTGSHSNSFVRGVYDECLRIFDAKRENDTLFARFRR